MQALPSCFAIPKRNNKILSLWDIFLKEIKLEMGEESVRDADGESSIKLLIES